MTDINKELGYIFARYDPKSREVISRYSSFFEQCPKDEITTNLGIEKFVSYMGSLLNGQANSEDPEEVFQILRQTYPVMNQFTRIEEIDGIKKKKLICSADKKPLTLEQAMKISPETVAPETIKKYLDKLKQAITIDSEEGDCRAIEITINLYEKVLADFNQGSLTQEDLQFFNTQAKYAEETHQKNYLFFNHNPKSQEFIRRYQEVIEENLETIQKSKNNLLIFSHMIGLLNEDEYASQEAMINAMVEEYPVAVYFMDSRGKFRLKKDNALTLEQAMEINPEKIPEALRKKVLESLKQTLKDFAEDQAEKGNVNYVLKAKAEYESVLSELTNLKNTNKNTYKKILEKLKITKKIKRLSENEKLYFNNLVEQAEYETEINLFQDLKKYALDGNTEKVNQIITALNLESVLLEYYVNTAKINKIKQSFYRQGADIDISIDQILELDSTLTESEIRKELLAKRTRVLQNAVERYLFIEFAPEEIYDLDDFNSLNLIRTEALEMLKEDNRDASKQNLVYVVLTALFGASVGIKKNPKYNTISDQVLLTTQDFLYNAAEELAKQQNYMQTKQVLDLFASFSCMYMKELDEDENSIAKAVKKIKKQLSKDKDLPEVAG